MTKQFPILYNFIRCPYCIRARFILFELQQDYIIREIDLKNKPRHIFALSTKATVPIVELPNGKIIDESLDIVKYYIEQYGKEKDFIQTDDKINQFATEKVNSFIKLLNLYKYHSRYPAISQDDIKKQIEEKFLENYNNILTKDQFLFDKKSLADISLFPFIRQFALVDQSWFFNSKYKALIHWLKYFTDNNNFTKIIMKKNPLWNGSFE